MTVTEIAARLTEKVKAKMTGIVKAKILIISPGQSQTHLTSSSVFIPSRRRWGIDLATF